MKDLQFKFLKKKKRNTIQYYTLVDLLMIEPTYTVIISFLVYKKEGTWNKRKRMEP